MNGHPADRKILYRPDRIDAVIGIYRKLFFPRKSFSTRYCISMDNITIAF